MKIFSGSSNIPLATEIAAGLDTQLSDIELSRFPNGEVRVWVKTNVQRENVVLIQSFSEPVDFHIIEFSLIVDALRRAGARKIISVIPWFGYGLQDKMFRLGEPIAAKVIADFVSREVRRHILVNLHSDSIAGFFPVPATQTSALTLFVDYIQKQDLTNAVVVSPDFGAIKRNRVFSNMLELPQYYINKERDRVTGEITVHALSHPVKGKHCLVLDDLISTGGTVVEVADMLKENGAGKITFFATHALMTGDAVENMKKSSLDEIIVCNTVEVPESKQLPNMKILSIAPKLVPEIKIWV